MENGSKNEFCVCFVQCIIYPYLSPPTATYNSLLKLSINCDAFTCTLKKQLNSSFTHEENLIDRRLQTRFSCIRCHATIKRRLTAAGILKDGSNPRLRDIGGCFMIENICAVRFTGQSLNRWSAGASSSVFVGCSSNVEFQGHGYWAICQ